MLFILRYTELYFKSAASGTRTRTAITGQGILSPSCLPIPPLRQTKCKDNTNYWNSQDNCCFFIHLVLFFAISYTNTPY